MTRIMGILNVTPDSFSGDGVMAQRDFVSAAVDTALRMIEDGADIIDIGGESSRPGAEPVGAEEELRRVVPVITAIRKKLDQLQSEPAPIPPHLASPARGERLDRAVHQASAQISIDTVKPLVAEAALAAGATIINDISAVTDPAMIALAAKNKAGLVLMDNRSDAMAVTRDAKIGGEYTASETGDIVGDVTRDLAARAAFAEKSGLARDKIILDPGLGFGKTVEQNLVLVREIGRIMALGYPVLLGPSRKSFIGRVLGLPVEDRLEGTAAIVSLAAFLGADILRVHDVKVMARAARMAATIREV